MRRHITFPISFVFSFLLVALHSVALSASDDHPRLLFPKSEEAAVKKRIKSDPLAGAIYKELLLRADYELKREVCKFDIPDGRRLLGQSRQALNTIVQTAMAWRLSGERKYLDRAIQELDAACGLKDWNPSHFLDTAEMSTAVAIGYDWLYHELSDEQRQRYARELRKKGLEPARNAYTQNEKAWWTDSRNNWTQVCATGLLFAERALEKPNDLIHPARVAACESLEACSKFYFPSGGYPEGPAYWHYGSNYHILGIAVVRGDRPELSIPTPPEFLKSALFPEHLTGPTGMAFNFADSSLKPSRISAAQSWMASEFGKPRICKFIRDKLAKDISIYPKEYELGRNRFFALHLIWLPEIPENETGQLALDSSWQGEQPLATFRSSWEDSEALFVAIKGGYPGVSHGQMDIGSFILESDGVRWVEDLGSDNYNLPSYFGSKRWDYFRLTNLSHNTLVIGGKLQDAESKPCPMVQFSSDEDKASATFDLTSAYATQVKEVIRHCEFDRKNKKVTLTDTISGVEDSVRWAIMTSADIEIRGKVATLKKEGEQLKIVRNDTHGGTWKILDAKPPKMTENQNEGVKILTFTAPKAEKLGLSVSFITD